MRAHIVLPGKQQYIFSFEKQLSAIMQILSAHKATQRLLQEGEI